MAIIRTFECDGCKELMHKVNGTWYVVVSTTSTITIHVLDPDKCVQDGGDIKHICGIECLHKAVGEATTKLSAASV